MYEAADGRLTLDANEADGGEIGGKERGDNPRPLTPADIGRCGLDEWYGRMIRNRQVWMRRSGGGIDAVPDNGAVGRTDVGSG